MRGVVLDQEYALRHRPLPAHSRTCTLNCFPPDGRSVALHIAPPLEAGRRDRDCLGGTGPGVPSTLTARQHRRALALRMTPAEREGRRPGPSCEARSPSYIDGSDNRGPGRRRQFGEDAPQGQQIDAPALRADERPRIARDGGGLHREGADHSCVILWLDPTPARDRPWSTSSLAGRPPSDAASYPARRQYL